MSKYSSIDWSLFPEFILGAEGDDDADSSATGDSSQEDQDGARGASDDSSGDTESHDEHDDADDPNVKGLKSALAKERRERARLEKEAKARAKADEEAELKKKSDIEQAQERERKANERLEKLTAGYRTSAIDRAIERAAKDFIDPDDAISGVDRSEILVEQDPDDPAKVTVDQKSVERAVKALGAKKSHFLKAGTTDGEPTGSQRSGSRRQDNEKTAEQVYRDRYPSLS